MPVFDSLGYATDILMGAMSYSEHAGKAGKLDLEDVELAVQETVNWGFKQAGEREVSIHGCMELSPQRGKASWLQSCLVPVNEEEADRRRQPQRVPSRSARAPQYLMPLAQEINSHPLPIVPESSFIRLPHPRHLLTAPNFNLVPNKVCRWSALQMSPSGAYPSVLHCGFSAPSRLRVPLLSNLLALGLL